MITKKVKQRSISEPKNKNGRNKRRRTELIIRRLRLFGRGDGTRRRRKDAPFYRFANATTRQFDQIVGENRQRRNLVLARRDCDKIETGRKFAARKSKRFSKQTLPTVANKRFADFFRNGKAQPTRRVRRRRTATNGQSLVVNADSRSINELKIGRAFDFSRFIETERSKRFRRVDGKGIGHSSGQSSSSSGFSAGSRLSDDFSEVVAVAGDAVCGAGSQIESTRFAKLCGS